MPSALWDHGHPGIFVDSSNAGFFTGCCNDLTRINSRDVGKDLLKLISDRARGIGTKVGKRVDIAYTNDLGSVAQGSVNLSPGSPLEVRKQSAPGSIVRLPAVGDSSLVEYGHDLDYAQLLANDGENSPWAAAMVPFVALAHELIHALHVISGDVVKDYFAPGGALIEEARTVGIGPYAKTRFSENAIRHEHGITLRTYYNTAGDADSLPSLTG